MRILAIDTALAACQVALTDGGAVCARISEPMQRGHAERLAPMVQEAALSAGFAFPALDRIVVTTGPGSFTGVRVGLAFARGLALALGKPCVGVSTLMAIALEDGEGGLRAAAIPAPGGLFAAVYEAGRIVRAPALVGDDEVPGLQSLGATWRGPGAGAFDGVATVVPDIVALAHLGARLDPAAFPPTPAYLRPPDAKLPST